MQPDQAFRELVAPHRRELHVHCYRMLGSLQDAEDLLQETLLAAWQGFARFEHRASLRTWLYKIATNRCLNALRTARRRPAKAWDVPGIEPPAPTSLGEVAWLDPFPDALAPAYRYDQLESISLGFVTALQLLPRRQLAALLLCDVIELEASEVATMLDTTVDAVNSALKRARASMNSRRRSEPPPAASPVEDALVAKFVRAWESADVTALVSLLTDDVFISMPPIPNEYVGRDLAAHFFQSLFVERRRFQLVPTRANGQPAFGAFVVGHPAGLHVLTLNGDRITAMTRFETNVLPWFGLPAPTS